MQRSIKLLAERRVSAGFGFCGPAGLFPAQCDFFIFPPAFFESLIDLLTEFLELRDCLGLHVEPGLFADALGDRLVRPVHLPQAEYAEHDDKDDKTNGLFHSYHLRNLPISTWTKFL